jgi:hypothetical protein
VSPLSEALTAAQRSALAALEKAYVAGKLDPREDTPEAMSAEAALASQLHKIGISDPVDVSFLASALDVLREWGVSAPNLTERVTEAKVEPASQKQWDYIHKLCEEKHTTTPGGVLTKAQASQAIEQLQSGKYDPESWNVPF